MFVSDDSLLGEVESIDGLLGPVEIGVAEERIAGVDAVIRLGSSFLDRPGAEAVPETTDDATEATVADDAGPDETVEPTEATEGDDDDG